MSDDTRKTKGGRPPKPDHKKQHHSMYFSVTHAERDEIESRVEAGDYNNRAAYLRDCVLSDDRSAGHRIPEANRQAAKQIGAIGTNINQSARALNKLARNMRELLTGVRAVLDSNDCGAELEEFELRGLVDVFDAVLAETHSLHPKLNSLQGMWERLEARLLGQLSEDPSWD